uniref:Uncharacterized protein n=1 Tax=Anguilla anguilla TaxID=7936 RepID=A0A0E9T9M3_ANGAN
MAAKMDCFLAKEELGPIKTICLACRCFQACNQTIDHYRHALCYG